VNGNKFLHLDSKVQYDHCADSDVYMVVETISEPEAHVLMQASNILIEQDGDPDVDNEFIVVRLGRDSVAAMVAQLQSWLERTANGQG
jgi:hypothetical protein